MIRVETSALSRCGVVAGAIQPAPRQVFRFRGPRRNAQERLFLRGWHLYTRRCAAPSCGGSVTGGAFGDHKYGERAAQVNGPAFIPDAKGCRLGQPEVRNVSTSRRSFLSARSVVSQFELRLSARCCRSRWTAGQARCGTSGGRDGRTTGRSRVCPSVGFARVPEALLML